MQSCRQDKERKAQVYEREEQGHYAVLEQVYLSTEQMLSNNAFDSACATTEGVRRLKSQFVATMSHELRTPLNAIIGFSYILKQQLKGPLNEVQHDYVQRIYNSSEYLLRLLNDILDSAKLEAGHIHLKCEPVPLEPLIHEAVLTTTSLLGDKPIELRHVISPELPLALCDRLRVAQVLLNLLSNAAKFTERGSITIRAFLQSEASLIHDNGSHAEPTRIIVEVSDTGVGIAPEHLSVIFEEYQQADEMISRHYGGTGLGLSISKRFVELHGGTLTVSSVPGQGSTFRFTLPVAERLDTCPSLRYSNPLDVFV